MTRARVTAALVAVLVASACGGGDDAGPGERPDGDTPAADASLDVTVEPVDAGVRISWTVTNDGEDPLLVFDNVRGDEAEGEPLRGAYVTGGEGGVVEVSRRLFPVPGDVEGVQDYMVTAGGLEPGASEARTDSVTLPFTYGPAAPEGGGDELPEDPARAVFCLGVAPPDAIEAARPLGAGRWAVPHSEENAARQTLLCSEPFDV
ncbi:MAG TPA: hypothetical protein VFB77_04790 [Acidimicrobiales bacterium]|nr:hypothetical protein [Acidimicrobiales bacterium]